MVEAGGARAGLLVDGATRLVRPESGAIRPAAADGDHAVTRVAELPEGPLRLIDPAALLARAVPRREGARMIRLLVVDDSALMRKVLGGLFAAEGDFTLAFARDGLEALDLLPRFEPDVVTLDVTMPGSTGSPVSTGSCWSGPARW